MLNFSVNKGKQIYMINIINYSKQYKKQTIIFIIIFIIALTSFLTINTIVSNATQEINETIVPILTYHKFCKGDSHDDYTINIKLFEKQMSCLVNNGYRVISIAELLQCIENNFFPEKPVVITIDDGFKSVYNLAHPVLKKYELPATIFLYTDFIANNPNQLSWQEIKEMIDNNIEIGSHTLSHCNLLNMKQSETHMDYLKRIEREISLSKLILEKHTGVPVQSFAYPYGVYNQQIKMLAKQAGYKALLNVNGMNNSIPFDTYSLNRQIIPADITLEQFKRLLQEKTLKVDDIFPADGTVTNDQGIKVGAILNNPEIDTDSLFFRLSGSGSLDYTYCDELQEISFTPSAPKLLQKRTWIANITAYDKKTGNQRKIAWLFTIK